MPQPGAPADPGDTAPGSTDPTDPNKAATGDTAAPAEFDEDTYRPAPGQEVNTDSTDIDTGDREDITTLPADESQPDGDPEPPTSPERLARG